MRLDETDRRLTRGDVAISLLAVGMAYAATKACCTPTCKGTSNRDHLTGTEIDNVIYGKAKGDTIIDVNDLDHKDSDHDTIYGGDGSGVINVREGNQKPAEQRHRSLRWGHRH